MKNTEKILEGLAAVASLDEEARLKKIGEISALYKEDCKSHDDLVQRHEKLATDYGTLVVAGVSSNTEQPAPQPQPQSLEQIVDSVLKRGK